MEFAYVARVAGTVAISNASIGIDHATLAFTAAQIAAARAAVITALATDGLGAALGGINFLYEGTAPSVALGHHLPAGSTVTIRRQENIALLHFIRSDTVDGRITVTLEY